MIPNTPRLVIASLMFCLSFTAHAEIYKWTDAAGNTHYSQTPPENTATKAEDIGDEIDMAAGTAQGGSGEPVKKETTEKDEMAQAKKAGEENSIKHQTYCDQQRNALKKLLSSPVIRWKSGDSEKVLSAKERKGKIAEFEKSIKELCNKDVLPQKKEVSAE